MKKNLPDRYFYPAVFIYEDGQEIAVDFPDLGVATRGTSEDDAPPPRPCPLSSLKKTSGSCWSMPICRPSGSPASIVQ